MNQQPRARYTALLTDLLTAQARLASRITARKQEIAEYCALRATIAVLAQQQSSGDGVKTLVDLGAGVYCRARVPDTGRVCVHIGCGIHLELKLDKALDAVDAREAFLAQRASALKARHLQVSADLNLARLALGKLDEAATAAAAAADR